MKGNGKYYDIEDGKEMYNVRLAFDDKGYFMKDESSCPCKFGSWDRWTKKNKGKQCDHVKEAYKLYQNEKTYKKEIPN
jgi:hypothetical protein